MESKVNDLVVFYPDGHQEHLEMGHPERPERVEAIRNALREKGWWDIYPQTKPVVLDRNILESVHTRAYLSMLEDVSKHAAHLDMDTYTTPASWKLALNAAGGAVAVASQVWRRVSRRGIALTRPPGHHATTDQGMGFCLINNIAVAAQYLIQVEGASRLAIIDLDLHHGNGTQDIFWHRGDVFYFSTHQSPLYPGSGSEEETGHGAGERTTANFPLPPGSGDKAFLSIMDSLILPLLKGYDPEMILVSFGFDPHWRDPLGSLLLSAAGYGKLIERLTNYADENAQGKIALFLEGGYDLDAGAACSQAAVAALIAQQYDDPLGPSPQEESRYWMVMAQRAREIWNL